MKIINRHWAIVSLLSVILSLYGCSQKTPVALTSPDQKIQVHVSVNDQDKLAYSIERAGQPVLLPSELGIALTRADFTQDVSIESRSSITQVHDTYELQVGKKSRANYHANEQHFTIVNAQKNKLTLTFRVSNDGVAFRYTITDPTITQKQFTTETTSFEFAPNNKAWLQPMAIAQTGWSNTNPSYEEDYQDDVPVGTESSLQQGWVFPALFNTGDDWVVITEAGLAGNWHASHLQLGSKTGQYTLAPPQPEETFISLTGERGALLANSNTELVSPWRVIAIGSLAQIMESTLGTDLAAPAIDIDQSFIKPGHSSWSWAILKEDFTTFDVQKEFIDYAADMHWHYTLIDADWDQKIGYEKLAELVAYAAQKNIGILVWYNSAGAWNTTPYTPKSQLLSHEQRVAEFSRLQAIGVKGVKIDFFGGDGQSFIQYYLDILQDAASHHLLVNFHGSTIPRGWQRTYPNLMTMEAIKGFEFTTFTQENQDSVAPHVVTALFTRNLFDPMDFTPMAFGEIPNIKRVTENSFELAESVLMTSGIQHFAAIPAGMATVPDYVKDFLRNLPSVWDEIKFIDGYPGKFIVLARRAGNTWYVAGINAEDDNKTLTLDLSFIGGKQGIVISSGETDRDFRLQKTTSKTAPTITLRPSAGFVMVLE